MLPTLNRYELGDLSNQTGISKENQEAINTIIDDIKTIPTMPDIPKYYVVIKVEGCPGTITIDNCQIDRIGDTFHFKSGEKTLVVPVGKIVYFWKSSPLQKNGK